MGKLARLTVACAAAAIVPALAAAQTAPSAPNVSGALEEIVVTAQKREESAQKTPISMSVFSAEDIVRSGIHDLPSLTGNDPSINFVASNGTAYLALRGVASSDLTEIGDPAVSVSRDGFFTNRAFGLFSSFYDVNRVEVLKGPQGTLYGRNSSGGIVNIITNRPGKEFGGYASVEAGSYDARNLEAAINVPFADRLQFRVSGISRKHDGYRDNGTIVVHGENHDQKGDDEDSQSLRAQLAAQFTDDFTGWVSYQHDEIGGVGDVSAHGPLGQVFVVPDSKSFAQSVPTSVSLNSNRVRWEFNYSHLPGDLTLTYLGGRDSAHWHHILDATGLVGPFLFTFDQLENPVTWNHELRLASAPGDKLAWQVGAFYFKDDNDPLSSTAYGFSGPFDNNYLITFHYKIKAESKAVFGQASYALTDDLKLSAGARYTKASKVRTGDNALNLVPVGGPLLPSDGAGESESVKPSWHLGADWSPTPTSLYYAKFDTGFKDGGFSGTCNGVATYDPETVEAVEVGTKNRFSNNRLQVNAAAFGQEYKGYQASQFSSGLCPGGATAVQNAGKARIYGLEGNITAIVDPIGKLDLSVSFLHTEFTQFDNAVDGSTNPPTIYPSIAGNELPAAPKASATFGVEHTWQGAVGGVTARVDGKYEAKKNYSFFNFPDTETKATTTLNAAITYEPTDAKWNVMLYVRNLTDETVLIQAARFSVANTNNYEFAPPRVFGVKLTARW